MLKDPHGDHSLCLARKGGGRGNDHGGRGHNRRAGEGETINYPRNPDGRAEPAVEEGLCEERGILSVNIQR